MIRFGAIVKRIARAVDRAADAVEREVLAALAGRPKPKPCPIYVPAEPARGRR